MRKEELQQSEHTNGHPKGEQQTHHPQQHHEQQMDNHEIDDAMVGDLVASLVDDDNPLPLRRSQQQTAQHLTSTSPTPSPATSATNAQNPDMILSSGKAFYNK